MQWKPVAVQDDVFFGQLCGPCECRSIGGLFILDMRKRSMGLKPMFGMQIPLVWTCVPGQADLSSMLPDNMLRCLFGKALLSGVYFHNLRQCLEQVSFWSRCSGSVSLSCKSCLVGSVCSKQAR